MSTYKVPVYATSLIELPWVLKQLDRRYGTVGIEEIKTKNGQYAIRYILKHLSYHNDSTCEEIAKAEHDKNIRSQRKLKSVTDDVRKFVKNNLIRSQLVYEGEPKKVYNKQVKTYNLSPMGILYAIIPTDENVMSGFELTKIDYKFIRTLAKNYEDTLPKIFGRFKLFEKIFGKDFESMIIYSIIQIYSDERMGIPNEQFLLPDYVLTGYYYTNPRRMKSIHRFIAEQISLVFYIRLKESIVEGLQDKRVFQNQDKLGELIKMSRERPEEYKKIQTKKYLETLKKAKQKWLELMNEDKELKKWYNNFLEEAVRSKKREYGVISQYHKEGLSKKYQY